MIGVGYGKSGTHSLVGLFRHYRAAHEPDRDELLHLVIARLEGRASDDEVRSWLVRRDQVRQLEVDSSMLNGNVAADLASLFPDARFVLTVRDPRSNTDAVFNHLLEHTLQDGWARLRALQGAGPRLEDPGDPADDDLLRRLGLGRLADHLAGWANHHTRVLDAVPPERLLVLPTAELGASVCRMAAFVGVDPETLDAASAHRYRATRRYGVLARLDPGYVDAEIERWCGPARRRIAALGVTV